MIRSNSLAGLALLSVMLMFWPQVHAYGTNYSCAIGKRGACLDYGDSVCPSSGKCVSKNTNCFNSYDCDDQGFACKSEFNELADDFDILQGQCKSVLRKNSELVDQYNKLVEEYNSKRAQFKSLGECVRNASTLDEAKRC